MPLGKFNPSSSFREQSDNRTEMNPTDWARAFKCAALREVEHHVISGALIPDVLVEVITTPEDDLEREQEAYLEERLNSPKVHIVMIQTGKRASVHRAYTKREDADDTVGRIRHGDSCDHAWVETQELL